MANIELSKDYENLINEIQELKNTLTETIFKYDELKYIICKNIKTQYMLEIGTLEYLVYKDYCLYLRLKRKAERIRIHIYRQEKIDLKIIDADLDQEFADYQKRLDDRAEEITKAAGELEKEVLTTEETREIKSLYRKLIKKLHPDLHPDQTSDKIELFHKVVEAYKNGNLTLMQVLAEVVDANVEVETKSTMEELAEQRYRLLNSIDAVKEKIHKTKTTIPYIWKEILDDPIKKEEKIAELKEAQSSFEAAIDTLKDLIKNLLEETDDR